MSVITVRPTPLHFSNTDPVTIRLKDAPDESSGRSIIGKNKVKLPNMPSDIMNYIAMASGFREVYLLRHFLLKNTPERFLKKYGPFTIEEAISTDKVHAAHYYFEVQQWSLFRRMILLSRAIHLKNWSMVRQLSAIHDIPTWKWDLLFAVRQGIDEVTLKQLFKQYSEIQLEKLRPMCLYEAEQNNNSQIFCYLVRECKLQRRWKKKIRNLILSVCPGYEDSLDRYIEENQY